MCVTNNIRDEVIFDNLLGWDEKELTNEKIIAELENEYKRPFLSYAYGIYVTRLRSSKFDSKFNCT